MKTTEGSTETGRRFQTQVVPAIHPHSMNRSCPHQYAPLAEGKCYAWQDLISFWFQLFTNMTFSNKAFIYATSKEMIKLGMVCDLNLLLSLPALNGLLPYPHELITKVYST